MKIKIIKPSVSCFIAIQVLISSLRFVYLFRAKVISKSKKRDRYSISQIAITLAFRQAKARILELNPGLQRGWQGPKHLAICCFFLEPLAGRWTGSGASGHKPLPKGDSSVAGGGYIHSTPISAPDITSFLKGFQEISIPILLKENRVLGKLSTLPKDVQGTLRHLQVFRLLWSFGSIDFPICQ